MALRDGTAAVLSAVVVAGLAVGLGFGAHVILPKVEVSPSANATPSQGAEANDFCALIDDMVDDMDQMNAALLSSFLQPSAEDASEAEALDFIHEFGRLLVDSTGAVSDDLSRAATLVTDPEVADAFAKLAHSVEGLGEEWGTAALEAESVEGYTLAMDAMSADPEFATIMSEGDAAEPIVTQYVLDTCGINLGGDTGTGTDTALKTDVSTLGMEIATYYVDWSPGDPQPVISVADDMYYLNGELIGGQSTGVILTNQYALGPADWCVEVSSETDSEMVFSYSAMHAIQSETCASLQS